MTVEENLFTRLSNFAGLTALVSTRIFPNILPQKPTFPAISYRRVSAVRASCMGVDRPNVEARFQVDIWALTYTSARQTADQVRKALQRYNTTDIEDIFIESEIELYEDESRTHHIAVDFIVHYLES